MALSPVADLAATEQICRTGAEAGLIGMKCNACQTLAFPRRAYCCACGSSDTGEASLAPQGQLYSFSTVHISATRETPYTIGYIDLDDGVRVMGAIATSGEPRIGDRMAVQANGESWWFSEASAHV